MAAITAIAHDSSAMRSPSESASSLSATNVALALAAYCALAIAFTWPAAIDINHIVVGSEGDELGGIWWLWARINGHIDIWGCTLLVNWPNGMCSAGASQPLVEWPLLGLATVTNEIAALSLFIIIALILSAFTGFALLRSRGFAVLPALWGGAAMAFSPPILMQASTGHLAYPLSAPVILAFHFAEHWWSAHAGRINHGVAKTPTSTNPALGINLGVALALVFWSSIYTGYFLAVALVALMLAACVRIASAQPAALVGSRFAALMPIARDAGVALGIALIAALAGNWVLFYKHFGWLPPHVVTEGAAFFSRDISELQVWGARPWDYLRASTAHPFWGDVLQLPQGLDLHGSNIFEASLWPGSLTVALAAIALFVTRKPNLASTSDAGNVVIAKTRLHHPHRALARRGAVAATFFAFLSLPPTIDLGVVQLPTLAYFLHPLAPMFRVYARAGIYAAMLLAIVGTVGIAWLYKPFSDSLVSTTSRTIALVAGLVVLDLDMLPAWPGRVFITPIQPEWVSSLRADQKPAAIVVSPWSSNDTFEHYQYLFWQRLHGHPIVNGQKLPPEKPALANAIILRAIDVAADAAAKLDKPITRLTDRSQPSRIAQLHARWGISVGQAENKPERVIDVRQLIPTRVSK